MFIAFASGGDIVLFVVVVTHNGSFRVISCKYWMAAITKLAVVILRREQDKCGAFY
jgi:hypothetical protein